MCTQLHRKIALSKVFKIFKVSTFTCFKLLLNKLYVFDMASKSSESKVVEEVLSRERNSQSTICLFQVISNSYTQGQDYGPPLHLRPCTVSVDGSNSERARLSNSRWSCSYKGGKRAIHFLRKVGWNTEKKRENYNHNNSNDNASNCNNWATRFKRKRHLIPICKVIKLYIQHCFFVFFCPFLFLTESSSKNSW